MYGSEKLQWYEGEVEVDAERAGCFAERQLRLGLVVVERATPETRDASGTPVERTKERLRTRIGAVHEHMGRAGTAQVLTHTAHPPQPARTPSTTVAQIRSLFAAQTAVSRLPRKKRNASTKLALLRLTLTRRLAPHDQQADTSAAAPRPRPRLGDCERKRASDAGCDRRAAGPATGGRWEVTQVAAARRNRRVAAACVS